MEGLGRLFDIGLGVAPVDINTGDGFTGKRINMAMHNAVTIVAVVGAAASGTDDLTLDVQQHTAYTGGTSGDLDKFDHFYVKSETLLDNDETWEKVTQTIASECTLTGTTYAARQKLVAIEVRASMLSVGYTHVSVDVAFTPNVSQLAAVIYLPHELRRQRTPAKLGNLLNPPAANV